MATLSDYLLREVRRIVERPTVEELRRRMAARAPIAPGESPARAVRAERQGT